MNALNALTAEALLRRSIKPSVAPPHANTQHQLRAPVAQQLLELQRLQASDVAAESLARNLRGCMVITFALMVLGLAVFFGLLLIPVVIGLWLWRRSVVRRDLEDRRLDAVARPLAVLMHDLKAQRPVDAFVDFRGYEKLPPQTQRTDGSSWLSPGPAFYAWTHDWLRLQLPMLDGTLVEVRGQCRIKRKSKPKRKYTKHKDVLKETLEVRVRLPPALQFVPDAEQRVQQRLANSTPMLHAVRIRGRSASLRFASTTATRVLGRAGWTGNGLEGLLDGEKVLRAIVRSHRAAKGCTAPTGGA